MERRLFCLAAVLVLIPVVFGPRLLSAHPPGDIKIGFESVSRVLKVAVIHSSRDEKKHYIDDVAVALNGKAVITQKFGQQTDKTGLIVSYILPDAQSGDTLTVTADCNIAGTMKKDFKIK